MLRARLTLTLLCFAAAPAAAQAPQSIDPGMSQGQVTERLGQPSASRTIGSFTYLFYKNGCVKVCGMDDVVILEDDKVVDAVFRSSERAYSGRSSSPRAIPAEVAARSHPGARDEAPGAVQQAGEPRPETKPEATPPADKKADTATPQAKPAHNDTTAKPLPGSKPDSVHDTTGGSLRIKVKPEHRSRSAAAAADSAHAGAAKKPSGTQ